MVPVDSIIKNLAMILLDDIGKKLSIRTLDSLQLASAVFFNNFLKIDYFVASDKKLLNVTKEFFQVLNPEEL